MYKVTQQDKWYLIKKDGEPLLTPMQRPVKTHHKNLAEKLVKDLKKYGEDPTNPISIAAFHYAMIDFFSIMPRSELEHSVAIGLNKNNDWTFTCPTANPEPMMNWYSLFGMHSDENVEVITKWLSSLNLMQLCAVCVIGRLIESVNIPYIVATKIDNDMLESYVKDVVEFYPYISVNDLHKSLDNFLFYFHLDWGTK